MVNSMIGIDVFNKANKKQVNPVILYAHPIKPSIADNEKNIVMKIRDTPCKLLRFVNRIRSIIIKPDVTRIPISSLTKFGIDPVI